MIGTLIKKAGVVAGLASALAVSLVVSMPSVAQADGLIDILANPTTRAAAIQVVEDFANSPAGKAELIEGAVTMLPEAEELAEDPGVWAVVGGVVAVGALGYALYANRDTILPWINGDGSGGSRPWGSNTTDKLQEGGRLNHSCCFSIAVNQPAGASTVNVLVTTGGSSGNQGMIGYEAWCKRTDGSQYQVKGGIGPFNLVSMTNAQYGAGACNAGSHEVVVGFQAHAGDCDVYSEMPYNCNVSYIWGPTNTVQWGDLSGGASGFDPHASTTKYTSTVNCIRPDGSTFSISEEWDGTYQGAPIPSCDAASKGAKPTNLAITGTNPLDGTKKQLLGDSVQSTPNYPECDPTKPSGSPCLLEVWIDGKGCMVGNVDCANWSSINASDPTRVQCKYGPYVVATSNCQALERAYESTPVWNTVPNTDGNPATRADASTDAQGNTQPSNPSSTPTDIGGAATGAQESPKIDPNSDECFPSGWGVFNPLAWVYQPVMCAFRDAFVPKTSTVTTLQTEVQKDVDQVGFGDDERAVAAMFQPIASGGGCAGPTIHFGMDGVGQDVQPFNACSEPLRTAAAVSNAVFSCVFVVMGGLVVMRAVSSAFGYQFSFGRRDGGA